MAGDSIEYHRLDRSLPRMYGMRRSKDQDQRVDSHRFRGNHNHNLINRHCR